MAKICTFFGHRIAPDSLSSPLEQEVLRLIVNENVDTFYIGKQGNFDLMASKAVLKLNKIYPHLKLYQILAYLPVKNNMHKDSCIDTIYPEGIEFGLPRFAIKRRNQWMIEQTDWLISFVCCSSGGAYEALKLANRMHKNVINLKLPDKLSQN